MTEGPTDVTRVVLFDDDPERIETWKKRLEALLVPKGSCEIEAVKPERFARIYEALKDRQSNARGTHAGTGSELEVLDTSDIVVVDFDLTPARGRGADIDDVTYKTLRGSFGDTFAYLTRCYTSAAYTVLVNQTFYQPTFDLTMREFELSAADLNITDSDLANPRLWSGIPERDKFRPWHWPRLLDAGQNIERLAQRVDLDAKVLETLGLDAPEVYDLFDTQQLEVLGVGDRGAGGLPGKGDPREATFGSITNPDSGFGARSKYEEPDEGARRRMAAAAVTHWLERIVIPGQNILVDAPHLAQRRPHLFRGERTLERLDRLADQSPEQRLDELLDLEALEVASTAAAEWTTRPVWLWPLCPRGPVGDDAFVFCEDGSFFREIDEAHEFRSELPGPFQTRFVAEVRADEGGFPIDYRPDWRFYAL